MLAEFWWRNLLGNITLKIKEKEIDGRDVCNGG
jgi:hypothetical protein